MAKQESHPAELNQVTLQPETNSDPSGSSCNNLKIYVSNGWTSSRKARLYITIGIWGFLTGVERAIILPTLWLYLYTHFSQNAAVLYYGATLAAFNVSVLITCPLYGFLSFCGMPVKTLTIISNQLEIAGNILYFLADAPWVVLTSRFVAGLGGGAEVPLYSDLVRCTTNEERTPVLVALLLARQLGLIVGPSFTLAVTTVKFDIRGKHFNVYNMPGLIMAILWAFHTIFTLVCYPTINREAFNTTKIDKEKTTVANYEMSQSNSSDDDANNNTENQPILPPGRNNNDNLDFCAKMRWLAVQYCPNSNTIHELKKYLKLDSVATIFTGFSIYVCIMALEAVLPPVAMQYFNWTEVQTSYVYLGCGGGIAIGYFILRSMAKCLKDRVIIMVGLGLLFVAYVLMTVTLFCVNSTNIPLYVALLVTSAMIHVFGVEFTITCAESLFTKVIPVYDADRAQSIYKTITSVAYLIGPYIGGALQMIPYTVSLTMLTLVITSISFCGAAFKLLNV